MVIHRFWGLPIRDGLRPSQRLQFCQPPHPSFRGQTPELLRQSGDQVGVRVVAA